MSDLDQILSTEPAPSSAPEAPAAPAPVATPAPEPAPVAAPVPPTSSTPAPQRPSLRRMVAFHEFADVECERLVERAAMIVHVWSDSCVNLVVWDQNGETRTVISSTFSSEPTHRAWSWPGRV